MTAPANENDQWRPHKDSIYRAAKAVLANYDEFGSEGGLDEYMEGLRAVLKKIEDETYGEAPTAPAAQCPSCAHGGLPKRLRCTNPDAPQGEVPNYVCADCSDALQPQGDGR